LPSLEGTTEAPHGVRAAFCARRVFATLAPDRAMATLRPAPDEQELKCLMRPDGLRAGPEPLGGAGLDDCPPRRPRRA
jgi:hypothetical protein